MEFLTTRKDNIVIVAPQGELMGGSDAIELSKIIENAVMDETVNFIFDLDKVSWMNSSGLGMLISALTTLRSSNGDIKLVNMSDRMRRPLQITKLDTVFEEFDTIDLAIASYK